MVTEEKEPVEEAPAPPAAEERPIFDLGELLRARRAKGETVGFWETLAYMDYQDRKEERLWRRQQMEMMKTSNQSNPEVEVLKAELSNLRKTVENLLETIQSQRQQEAQKQFVEGVVQQTTSKIMPEIQTIKQKLEEYDKKLATEQPQSTTNLDDIKQALIEAVDKLGEKVGASGRTIQDYVNDVDKIMSLIDNIEKRIKRPEGGEVDYKTMAVSTIGEIGKELVSAYREIESSKLAAPSTAYETPQPQTPAKTMQKIIKRQVQNYITQRMQAGATTINVREAANELGLTPGQVVWAYQTLMKEGWFHVQVPRGKGKVKKPETPEGETPPETETPETGEEQVFNPPAEA